MRLKSNEPFWLVKNGLLNTYPSLQENIATDFLIVGGGITGSLIAHQCMLDGYKTTLIDRREICNGSTSATTSMLQYEIDEPLHKLIDKIGYEGAVASYKACSESIDKLHDIVKLINSKCGFKKKDSLYFADKKKDVADLYKEFEARKEAGFPVSWLNAEEITSKFNVHNTHGGIVSKQGASMDAFIFAHDLMQYNVQKGLQVFDKTDLVSTEHHPRKVVITTDSGFEIHAKKVIYCNGFESVETIKEKFVDLISTYAIVSEPLSNPVKELKDLLVWNTADPYLYIRTTDDNRILIGGGDEDFLNPKKRDALLAKKSDYLAKKINYYFPDIPFITDFSWAGTFGTTKDGLPYIGAHPDFPNSYFVLGFGGNGITFSVIGMEMLQAMMEKKKHPLSEYFKFKR